MTRFLPLFLLLGATEVTCDLTPKGTIRVCSSLPDTMTYEVEHSGNYMSDGYDMTGVVWSDVASGTLTPGACVTHTYARSGSKAGTIDDTGDYATSADYLGYSAGAEASRGETCRAPDHTTEFWVYPNPYGPGSVVACDSSEVVTL